MPGVDGYDPGASFIFRTFKRKTTNPAIVWANSYEYVAYAGGGVTDLFGLAGKLVAFEKDLHCTSTEFVRVTASTWQADSRPYNPDNLVVWDFTGTLGTYTELGGGPAPLIDTWSLRRVARTGRSGKIFFRNCLLNDQITAPSGLPGLANPVLHAGRVVDALDNSGLGTTFGIEPVGGLGMVMKSYEGGEPGPVTLLRPVMDLVSFGVSVVQLDHKYYDVPEPTP